MAAAEPGAAEGVGEAGEGDESTAGGAERGMAEGEGEGGAGTRRGVKEGDGANGSGPRVVPVTGTCVNIEVSEVGPDPEAEEEGPRTDLPPGPGPGGAVKEEEPGTGGRAGSDPGRPPKTTGTSPREDSQTRN